MKKSLLLLILFFGFLQMYSQEFQIKLPEGISEKNILSIGLLKDSIPIYSFFTERQGLISIITEYFVACGEEIRGPYNEISNVLISSDSTALGYILINDHKWFYKVLIDGTEYIGVIQNGQTVYLDNNKIKRK